MKRQVVLITGCSTGVGRALCTMLKKEGYLVAASARNADSLWNLEADMKVSLDVSSKESVENAVQEVINRFGCIDVLINNAGYSVRCAVEEIKIDELKEMFDVNVYGIVRMMQAVVPYMREQGYGRIMNLGSVSGRMTGKLNGSYCATKHSVEAITEAAAYEMKRFGIEVTVLEPGAMDTDFFKKLDVKTIQMEEETTTYQWLYEKNREFRKKQKKADLEESVSQMTAILRKKKWRVHYSISLPLSYKILIHLPDSLKDALIYKFN